MHVVNRSRHLTAIAWLLSPLLLLSAGCSGCSEDQPGDGPADASVQDALADRHRPDVRDARPHDAPHDAGPDRHDGGKDAQPIEAGACGYIPRPADVPDGWVAMPVADCQQIAYAPPDRAHLPKPLTWIPCPSGYVPDSYQCRAIRMDWENKMLNPPFGIAVETLGYVEPNGTVVLGLNLLIQHEPEPNVSPSDYKFSMLSEVVEADGQVRQALWLSNSRLHGGPTNTLHIKGIAPGKSMFSAVRLGGDSNPYRYICLGGDDTSLQPHVYEDNQNTGQGICFAGEYSYDSAGRKRLIRDWNGKPLGAAYEFDGPAYSPGSWVGPNLLFALESGNSFALRMWSKDKGTYPLVDYGAGSGHGAGNPASDGKDLVWIEGTDWSDSLPGFQHRWVATSKYSPDPTELKPRRLTHWPSRSIGTQGLIPGVVGCGYAAYLVYHTDDPANINDLSSVLLVRLSDGYFWELPNVQPESVASTWGHPLAISCDELFVSVGGRHTPTKGSRDSVFRIRLDSLGPPSPPVP